ncbi:MAG: FG-GAP-like repeat-containing protein [Isosphaeraceae bacterium]|nr:FG-GAP-like repeat-containing protein [Isosphaeraceae bacterium]
MRTLAIRIAVAISLICMIIVLYHGFTSWSDGRTLARARIDLEQGRVASARESLMPLAVRRPDDADVAYLLGLAEEAAGNDPAALEAWGRVPRDSPHFPDVAIRSARISIDRGGFAAAEEIVLRVPAAPGSRAVDLRQILIQLYWHEGRLDEVRRLTAANYLAIAEAEGPRSPAALALLRSHLSLDLEPYPIDQFKVLLESYAKLDPDDDRVQLAIAEMALRSGALDIAAPLVDRCLAKRPNDPVVWRTRLELGVASDSLEIVESAIEHLTSNDLARTRAFEVAAWVFRKRNDAENERLAWLNLLELDKAHIAALQRLAELERAAGRSDKAAELRRHASEVDRAKLEYRGLLQSNYLETAKRMRPLAERLDRIFEAFAFDATATDSRPSAKRNHPMYGRFHDVGVDPILGAGMPLAEFVGLDQVASASPVADRPAGPSSKSEIRPVPPLLEEAASSSGLIFTYDNGRSPARQLPETMSGGLAVLDYDGDGALDVYAIQGGEFPPDPMKPTMGDRLFRNRRDGTFEDVTERAGIAALPGGYSLGAAAGDYDGDGDVDLFVTRWRSYALLRNRGNGTFEDATSAAGLGGDRDWPTSAAFADFDGDGDLDLYVDHYLAWDPVRPHPCTDARGRPSYCDPRLLPALRDHLFRNDGGRYVDVSEQAGIVDVDGRGLGVIAADLDDDGRVDLFVANDGTANFLFRNKGGMRFEEVGMLAGVAGNAEGGFQAGMGTACGDLDRDGRPDLLVTNFYGESTTYFQNLGEGFFGDRTASVGLAAPTRTLLGFGLAVADLNNDGALDIVSTNGHVNDLRPIFPYEMPCQLLLGDRAGRMRDVSASMGAPWRAPRVGRGLVVADMDDDGALDVLVLPQNSPLAFFRNRGGPEFGRFLGFQLVGTRSNRDAVGARVTIRAGGRSAVAWRTGGGSYQSAGDPRIHFGLGTLESVDEAEIRWPSGAVQTIRNPGVGRYHRIVEPDPNHSSGK